MPNNNNTNNRQPPPKIAPLFGKHANNQNTTNATNTTNAPTMVNSKINFHRKTSAEIVSEAKNMLAGGARLVSTRRPITPREPRRQLYGKQAPPGRPPSSFSLRYLQFESRAISTLPSLDSGPIPRTPPWPAISKFLRSSSVDVLTIDDVDEEDAGGAANIGVALHGKLPALLQPPLLAGSYDNLSEEMPPRMDFRLSHTGDLTSADQPQHLSAPATADPSAHQASTKMERNFPERTLKKCQSSSLDDPKEDAKGSKLKPVGKVKSNVQQIPQTAVGNKKRLIRNNDLLGQSSTETLLDLLKAHAGLKECSDETVSHINGILNELYTRVKGARGEWRGAVLGALYGLVECSSPKILLSVARVVLVLCVTGSNLTGACKLVFKVARNETNDMLFVDSDVPELLIDGLGRASPLEEPEACIYGYGAVRFLANASVAAPKDVAKPLTGSGKIRQRTIAHRLARHGAVQLMVLHLQMLNEAGATSKLAGPPLHALFQLSGALRVLAKTPSLSTNQEENPPSLYSPGKDNKCPLIQESLEEQDIQLHLACPHLIRSAEICIGDDEVQLNVIRTLSVLSEHPNCCETLADYSSRLGMLLGPCDTSMTAPKRVGILIRLGYVLGNIMARFDAPRSQFFNNDVAMEYLMQTLECYSKSSFVKPNPSGESVIDVLIKLVRVVANMSVNNEVGYGLGTRQSLGSVLLSLMLTLNNYKKNLSLDMEELLLATLGTLHNLSFYQDDGHASESGANRCHTSSMTERLADLSATLCNTMQSGHQGVQVEATRVLGNMTRSPVARKALCASGGLKLLVKNLEAEDTELVATSCGVLVNLLSDWERRAPFRELRGPYLLRDVLQRGAMSEDWMLAATVCQALWNFLIDTAHIIGALGEDEADYIVGDLAEYLDEESIFNGGQPDASWERFAVVAADLLERIQSSITYSISPCASSDDEDVSTGRIGNLWQGHFNKWLEDEN